MNVLKIGVITFAFIFLTFDLAMNASADDFPITKEFLESQRGPDGVWPDDPSVPDLPPLPNTDDPGLDPNSFLTLHYTNTVFPPKVANPPS